VSIRAAAAAAAGAAVWPFADIVAALNTATVAANTFPRSTIGRWVLFAMPERPSDWLRPIHFFCSELTPRARGFEPPRSALLLEAGGGDRLSFGEMPNDRLSRVAGLFGSLAVAAIEEANGIFSIGYREGRDVCVIARGKTWEEAFGVAEERVRRVDQMLIEQPATSNPTVATAAAVPVRFVRIRRRDVAIRKR
jgi:hypothetical protein